APRQDLSACTCRGSGARADCCAFSSAGNCPDDGAEHGSTTDEFAGALIGSEPFTVLRVDDVLVRCESIALPVNDHGIQVYSYFVIGNSSNNQLHWGSSGNRSISVSVQDILLSHA